MANKVAIFGGSFNPIHNGHLELAKFVMDSLSMSKVVFLPNANPPHKASDLIVSAQHRYNMVSLAIGGHNGFEISDFEMKTSHSYTVDTMEYMNRLYGDECYFVIGADSLYTLKSWKNYDKLIRICKFIVVDRNCEYANDIEAAISKLKAEGGYAVLVPMPKIDITSTSIRAELLRGGDVSDYLAEDVIKYISDNKLYRG